MSTMSGLRRKMTDSFVNSKLYKSKVKGVSTGIIGSGNNIAKERTREMRQAVRNSQLDQHILMSNAGIPRRKNGNKLGLRKRLETQKCQ